jgi:hypothetical protein
MSQSDCHCRACVAADVCCLQMADGLAHMSPGHALAVCRRGLNICPAPIFCFGGCMLAGLMTPEFHAWLSTVAIHFEACQGCWLNRVSVLIAMYGLLYVQAWNHAWRLLRTPMIGWYKKGQHVFRQWASTMLVVCTPGPARRTVVHAYEDCIPADMCDACSRGCSRGHAQQRRASQAVVVQWQDARLFAQVVMCSGVCGRACVDLGAPLHSGRQELGHE